MKRCRKIDAGRRIGCMLQGSWFNSAVVINSGVTSSVRPNQAKPLRFLRLVCRFWIWTRDNRWADKMTQSPNRRTIAWDEFASRSSAPPAYESLRERSERVWSYWLESRSDVLQSMSRTSAKSARRPAARLAPARPTLCPSSAYRSWRATS